MTFSLLVAGQSEWKERTARLFCKCYVPNVQINLFCWLLNKQKEEHMEQLFYKCYFSNVQMTFSLLVAGQSEGI